MTSKNETGKGVAISKSDKFSTNDKEGETREYFAKESSF